MRKIEEQEQKSKNLQFLHQLKNNSKVAAVPEIHQHQEDFKKRSPEIQQSQNDLKKRSPTKIS